VAVPWKTCLMADDETRSAV